MMLRDNRGAHALSRQVGARGVVASYGPVIEIEIALAAPGGG